MLDAASWWLPVATAISLTADHPVVYGLPSGAPVFFRLDAVGEDPASWAHRCRFRGGLFLAGWRIVFAFKIRILGGCNGDVLVVCRVLCRWHTRWGDVANRVKRTFDLRVVARSSNKQRNWCMRDVLLAGASIVCRCCRGYCRGVCCGEWRGVLGHLTRVTSEWGTTAGHAAVAVSATAFVGMHGLGIFVMLGVHTNDGGVMVQSF